MFYISEEGYEISRWWEIKEIWRHQFTFQILFITKCEKYKLSPNPKVVKFSQGAESILFLMKRGMFIFHEKNTNKSTPEKKHIYSMNI